MNKQTFIFFTSVLILIILSSYILISSTEKKVAVTSSEPVDIIMEKVKVIPNESQNHDKYDIKIGLRFNSRGELIQFDSIYSQQFYTSLKNSLVMDSMIKEFNRDFTPIISQRLEDLFFADSMLYYDFFHSDFFHSDFFSYRYALNRAYMEDVMAELDSIKNNFFINNKRFINSIK